MKFHFQKTYFLLFFVLLAVEVCIGAFASGFIRTFVGDVLVIALLYCFLSTYVRLDYRIVLLLVLLFAFGTECLQYYRLVDVLHIQNKIARIIIGTTYDVHDLIAYTVGGILVFGVEFCRSRKVSSFG